jgi:UDPglucose 6-dehydrogenase
MHAREAQAKNLALYLVEQAELTALPIVIHGKAYKPDVPYCIGSYSTLIGHYIKESGHTVVYVDPLADDQTDVVDDVDYPAVVLMAHNRNITYGYTGEAGIDHDYFEIKPGSLIVDPWRGKHNREGVVVIHYGNSRTK